MLRSDGVFALRALSAFAGTCVVAGVVALGRRLWGVREGLAGGLLAAASPYMVWYSQEVRMYILAAAWGALLVWLTLDLACDPSRGSRRPAVRVAWVLVALAALHTHYFAGATALASRRSQQRLLPRNLAFHVFVGNRDIKSLVVLEGKRDAHDLGAHGVF